MNTTPVFFLAVLGCFDLSVGALRSKRGMFEKKQEICKSKECEERAQVIRSFMDESVNPCEDFYSYACGTRNRNRPNGDNIELIRINEENWKALFDILSSLPSIQDPRNTTESVLFMYQTCLKNRSVEEDVEGVRRVLKENEFGAWPLLGNEKSKLKFQSLDQLLISTDLPNQFFTMTVGEHPLDKHVKILVVVPSISIPDSPSEVEERAKAKNSPMVVEPILHNKSNDEKHRRKQAETEMAMTAAKLIARDASDEQLMAVVKEYQEIKSVIYEKSNMPDEDPDWTGSIKQVESKLQGFPLLEVINAKLRRINITLTYNDTIRVHKPQALENIVVYLLLKKVADLYNFIGMANVVEILYASSPTLIQERERILKQYQIPFHPSDGFPDCRYILVPSIVSTLYVLQRFDAESKAAARSVLNRIGSAYNINLKHVRWMDAETRPKALKKLRHMKLVVGYSDTLLDEKFVKSQYYYVKGLVRNDTYSRIHYLYQRNIFYADLSQLKGEDPFMFQEESQNAIASYSADTNYIRVSAGILRDIMFHRNLPMYLNLGAIGMMMGHEISHAFDSIGRHYDGEGKVVNWWTKYTNQVYEDKASCFVEQYSKIRHALTNTSLDGLSSLAENLADNVGVRVAFHAFRTLESHPDQPEVLLPGLEKLTPEQLFFISFAMPWCAGESDRPLRPGDLYAPPKYRVNVPLKNMEEFSAAFQCKKGSPMRLTDKERCVLW